MPKTPAKPVILPGRLVAGVTTRDDASAVTKGSVVPKPREGLYNASVLDLRNQGKTKQAIRQAAHQYGYISTAAFNIVEVAYSGWSVCAYGSTDHAFNLDGSLVAMSLLALFDNTSDYSEGFSQRVSVAQTIETCLREVALTGDLALELVLDKARLPDRLQVVNSESIELVGDGKGGKYPRQVVASGAPIELNTPTFFMAALHKDAGTSYGRSMYEPALYDLFEHQEFIEDVRRVVRRSGHTRLVVKLDTARMVESAPPAVKKDPAKLLAFLETQRKQVEDSLKAIKPEDAYVYYDAAEPDHLQSGLGTHSDYTPLLDAQAGRLATSLKSPPTVLGLRLEGSQAIGNIESLLFLKAARAIQRPVETVMSRALTLACRLMGADVYARFEFDPIDLRPASELEAFRTLREQRIYEQLSLGFLTDDEAAWKLGTGPRAPGAPELSGTFFNDGQAAAGAADATNPGDSAAGRTLQPDKAIPRKAGGKSQ